MPSRLTAPRPVEAMNEGPQFGRGDAVQADANDRQADFAGLFRESDREAAAAGQQSHRPLASFALVGTTLPLHFSSGIPSWRLMRRTSRQTAGRRSRLTKMRFLSPSGRAGLPTSASPRPRCWIRRIGRRPERGRRDGRGRRCPLVPPDDVIARSAGAGHADVADKQLCRPI